MVLDTLAIVAAIANEPDGARFQQAMRDNRSAIARCTAVSTSSPVRRARRWASSSTFGDATFMPEDKSHITEELVDVELQRFRQVEIVAVEIHVVSEVVDRRDQRLIIVRYPLRRGCPDEVVVPQRIGVRRTSTHPVHGRIAAQRRRAYALCH